MDASAGRAVSPQRNEDYPLGGYSSESTAKTGSGRSRSVSDVSSASSFSLPSSPKSVEQCIFDSHGNRFHIPGYTIQQIRDAIPKHCYERSALKGFYFVIRDLACLAGTFYFFQTFCQPQYVPYASVRALGWATYTFLQGLFGTGVWILAHECGHQAFSASSTLNDTVGWVLHSLLLVPYFSWKISHAKHHNNTGNIDKDMAFVPMTRQDFARSTARDPQQLWELCEETPVLTLTKLLGHQLFGWFAYLFFNASGHDNHETHREGKGIGKKNGDWTVNHFIPASPLYSRAEERLILLSDVGLAIVIATLVVLARTYGPGNILLWYGVPYLWVNHWLVMITYLHHTDPSLPHYDSSTWKFTRGAAATIDREFGYIGRNLFHSIIETHVLHHHVSTIPFYHADEATEAIKPVMGDHYRSAQADGIGGFLSALWVNFRACKWVEPNHGSSGEVAHIYFFRNESKAQQGMSKRLR